MTDLGEITDDLVVESAELDALASGLNDAGWRLPTPAAGWTVAHQIAHLAWTDEATGPTADAWLDIAQAFAGPPGPGRLPSTRPASCAFRTGELRAARHPAGESPNPSRTVIAVSGHQPR